MPSISRLPYMCSASAPATPPPRRRVLRRCTANVANMPANAPNTRHPTAAPIVTPALPPLLEVREAPSVADDKGEAVVTMAIDCCVVVAAAADDVGGGDGRASTDVVGVAEVLEVVEVDVVAGTPPFNCC